MKHSLLITLTGFVLLFGASNASAGKYTVNSCGSGASSSAWTMLNSDPASMQAGEACGTAGTNGGLYAQTLLGSQGASARTVSR